MKNFIICFCDSNHSYMKKIASYFMNKIQFPVKIMTFSTLMAFEDYLKENLSKTKEGGRPCIDLLLIDQQSFEKMELQAALRDFWTIVLEEQEVELEISEDKMMSICRYQSAGMILNYAMELLARTDYGESGTNRHGAYISTDYEDLSVRFHEKREDYSEFGEVRPVRKGKLIGIFSPVGRCGKTTLAVLMTSFLSKEGNKRYLLLTLDPYAQDFYAEHLHLGELIYELYSVRDFRIRLDQQFRIEDLKLPLEKYVRKSELCDYIPIPAYPENMLDVNGGQVAELLTFLTENSGYDGLIVDFGLIRPETMEMLMLCDLLIVPYKEDCNSKKKIERFEEACKEELEFERGEQSFLGFQRKMRKLVIPKSCDAEEMMNYYVESVWSPTGKFVKDYCEKLKRDFPEL